MENKKNNIDELFFKKLNNYSESYEESMWDKFSSANQKELETIHVNPSNGNLSRFFKWSIPSFAMGILFTLLLLKLIYSDETLYYHNGKIYVNKPLLVAMNDMNKNETASFSINSKEKNSTQNRKIEKNTYNESKAQNRLFANLSNTKNSEDKNLFTTDDIMQIDTKNNKLPSETIQNINVDKTVKSLSFIDTQLFNDKKDNNSDNISINDTQSNNFEALSQNFSDEINMENKDNINPIDSIKEMNSIANSYVIQEGISKENNKEKKLERKEERLSNMKIKNYINDFPNSKSLYLGFSTALNLQLFNYNTYKEIHPTTYNGFVLDYGIKNNWRMQTGLYFRYINKPITNTPIKYLPIQVREDENFIYFKEYNIPVINKIYYLEIPIIMKYMLTNRMSLDFGINSSIQLNRNKFNYGEYSLNKLDYNYTFNANGANYLSRKNPPFLKSSKLSLGLQVGLSYQISPRIFAYAAYNQNITKKPYSNLVNSNSYSNYYGTLERNLKIINTYRSTLVGIQIKFKTK